MTPDAPESRNQLIVALAIVIALAVLGTGALLVGWRAHQLAATITVVATIAGSLATALNAPSGIGKVITAAKAPPTPNPTQPLSGAEPAKVP